MQFFRIHSGPMLRSDRGRKTAFFRSLLEEHMKKTLALALLFAGTVGVAVSAQADSRTRFMAANCAYCHGPDGKSRGAIPSLAGLEKAYFVDQMKAFRDGKRDATVMQKHAMGYTDAEYEALGAWFAAIK
jgi:sulfide dehydrogenase cytochrome subunit